MFATFLTFFLKMLFLSDYMVPGHPKSRGIFSKVLAAKNAFWGGLKSPKMAIESKNAIFSKSEIMIPQSNLGKRKVKLMLVRP